jgi:4'-phosphopantetheinyl transferase
MPLIRKSRITKNTSLGIWKIEESAEELRTFAGLSRSENDYYESLRSDLRKKHWLSYRLILAALLGKDAVEIHYDSNGKPHLSEKGTFISVSHSWEFAAAVVSSEVAVGVDIEALKDRIERVCEKFLSAEEMAGIETMNRIEKLYICWGAKESLYKLHGNPEVEFVRDIIIEPFDYMLGGKGTCNARLSASGKAKRYPVHYEKMGDYMLVYALDS